jgi:hypothetical protein
MLSHVATCQKIFVPEDIVLTWQKMSVPEDIIRFGRRCPFQKISSDLAEDFHDIS